MVRFLIPITGPRSCRTGLMAACLLGARIACGAVLLTADVNRDGVLDPWTDSAGKAAWSWERGAVFLNNCDSDETTRTPDHADERINGPDDLKDLAPLRISRRADLPESATLTVSVDENSRARVRVFAQTAPGVYSALDLTHANNLDAALLRAGDVELRIEAKAFATREWNGRCRVTVEVQPPLAPVESDTVELRAAPFLLLSNAMRGKALYLREYLGYNDVMKNQLATIVPAAGAQFVVCPGGNPPYPNNNIWMQDAMELGCTEMPGQAMAIGFPSNRGSSWPLSNYPEDYLLGPDFGVFRCGTYRPAQAGGSEPDGWLDWYGNLEVTPPIPGYPHGRIYYGRNPATGHSLNPEIVDMLNAQELQGPALALDTGWLMIKHVDEMICWVPAADGGFRVLVPDTRVMYALLDKWYTDGLGSVPMLRVYNSTETVGAFRNDSSFRSTNLTLQTARIDPMIEVIKSQWGLTEADLIRVPICYYNGGAYVPSMINSAVLNGRLLVSDPQGPIVGGKDLLQEAFVGLLRAAGVELQVHFLDDWRYHTWHGNVHCATNVLREGFSPSIWAAPPESNGTLWFLR